MNKRGFMISFEVFAEVIILMVVILLFFGSSKMVTNDDLHIQQKQVHEIALLKDASLAAPEKLEVNYRVPEGIKVEVNENCKVSVSQIKHAGATPTVYYCGVSKDERVELSLNEKNNIGVIVS